MVFSLFLFPSISFILVTDIKFILSIYIIIILKVKLSIFIKYSKIYKFKNSGRKSIDYATKMDVHCIKLERRDKYIL